MKYTQEQLEYQWNKDTPSCMSCGWSPCFYEVELEEESPGIYWAACVSKDDEDSYTHRGHWLYMEDFK